MQSPHYTSIVGQFLFLCKAKALWNSWNIREFSFPQKSDYSGGIIKKVVLTNFRGCRNPTEISFNDLPVFVGRNDVGESTVLEAIDLFFNEGKGVVKFDESDLTVGSEVGEYTIEVIFTDFPKEVIVDASSKTSLAEEYLLNR